MEDLERAMRMAVEQLRQLRAANAEMAGKLEIVELFKAILTPRTPMGMSEDAAWLLQRQIDALPKEGTKTEALG